MALENTKVLLVDDDPAMLRLLTKWLEAEGYTAIQAANGRLAIELIEREQPKILVTDWEMPVLDGLELCRWVRSQNFGHYVYTVFLTVRSHSADMLRGLEAGADDFLKKPVDRDELLARIRAGSRVMELERRLSLLANTDALTGLQTRRMALDHLQREWSRAQRYGTPLSCAMVDIDFFKRVNDSHGHRAGDDVLRQFAQLLSGSLRASDIAGRYGGEEFCVLLPETTEQQALAWAERTRSRIAGTRFSLGATELGLTASFGVAQRLADTASPEQLVDLADQALAAAKRAGRDRAIAYRQLIQPVPLEEHAGELTALLQVIPARDVMSSIVAPLNQDQTAATAADYFLRLRISSAPVTDAQGQLVGLLSEKDLMTIMLGQRWWALPIHQVMKRNVVCYEEDTPSLAIFEFLSRVAVGSVVIVQGGRPTGVLTRGCLLRFFMNVLATRLNGGVCPEVDQAARELVARMARSRPRDRIAQTVHALAVEVDDLQRSLAGQNGELLPAVVGSASRMQELLLDLLAASRSVHAADSQGPFRVQSENADYRRRSAASSAPGAARPVPAGDCVLHDAAG